MANIPPNAAATRPTVATTMAKMTISIASPFCLYLARHAASRGYAGSHFCQSHSRRRIFGTASMRLRIVRNHGDGREDQCQARKDQGLDKAYQ